MVVTVEGMVMEVSEEQYEKALVPMVITEEGNVRAVNAVQPEKQ